MKKGFKYFLYVCLSPKGRINRAWWWVYLVPSTFLCFGQLLWSVKPSAPDVAFLVYLYTMMILTYPSIVVCVKRFHDTNRSGFNILWMLIPTLGALYILIVCGFFKGTEGKNKYGEPSYLIGDWDSFTPQKNTENNTESNQQ